MSVAITELDCPRCEHRFELKEALTVRCRGPQSTDVSCRRCRHMIPTSISPSHIDRPPQPKGRSIATESGYTMGRLLFEDGVRYQFRETATGPVEEVVAGDEVIESFEAQLRGQPIDSVEDRIRLEGTLLEQYTVTGFKLKRAHLAAVLLD